MSQAFLIAVRFHDGRYHGSGDWPPSPARLFQALVAGAAQGGLSAGDQNALGWLESLDAPVIAAPSEKPGQSFGFFVPNNDLDAVGGDVRKIGKIRTSVKRMRPRLFDSEVPFLYVWTFEPSEANQAGANAVARIAEHLYQLGRGVDMAWATGEIIESDELERLLEAYPGAIYRPCAGGEGTALDCPQYGSLDGLCKRYQANAQRFTPTAQGKLLFTQAPKPSFRSVSYNSPVARLLFDLRDTVKSGSPFASWPLERVAELVQTLRGQVDAEGTPLCGAARRLWDALPDKQGEVSSTLIGRSTTGADKSRRIRILPLPSIGHVHVSRAIRRVLIEVLPNCPLRADDIAWAFSGLEVGSVMDEATGELLSSLRLVPADERSMLEHYGVGERGSARVWRSVTPLAVPAHAKRRRIDPLHHREQAKPGSERLDEQQVAVGAIFQALRHADVRASVHHVRVQREPFEAKGSRAEAFAPGTRFAKERLWHTEIAFKAPVPGPLVLGDGRYAGLGLMTPLRERRGTHVFRIESGLLPASQPNEIARALRRAVLARIQAVRKGERLSLYYTGHEADGSPARSSDHLAFAFDPLRRRLLVLAPHVLRGRPAWKNEIELLDSLDKALAGFDELRAGSAGLLRVVPEPISADDDPLFAPSRSWDSLTPYLVARHAKKIGAAEALSADVRAECRRRDLPDVRVTSTSLHGVPGLGLVGMVRLDFQIAVAGPILLGRSRYLGGGLFARAETAASP